MLRFMRQGQRWIMAAVIFLVGGVFVLFIGIGQPLFRSSGQVVIDVDGHQFGRSDVLRVRARQEEQYRQLLGDGFDAKALRGQLDSAATSSLLQLALLAREARALGLRASDEEIRDFVRDIPAFRDEQGKFQPKAVRDYAQYEYGTERNFVETVRSDLLAQKMSRLLASSAEVSDAEARNSLLRSREEIALAYVALDGRAAAAAEPTAEQVQELLAKDETQVRRLYEERSDRYHVPERTRARHVLFRVAKDATPEQIEAVRKKAEAALEDIRKGADFADVAMQLSEDPGSKERGGDLGFFQRGQMVKPFEDAAFALEPGTVSDLVRSDFGFHILRVEERKPAEDRAFEEVREELAREILAQGAARVEARRQADALSALLREGKTLEQAAREERISVERTAFLRRRPDGFVPGLGAAPEVLGAAFALRAEQPTSDRVFEVGDKLVLVQLLERKMPSADEISAGLEEERERLLREKRQLFERAWLEARRSALVEKGRLRVDLEALNGG